MTTFPVVSFREIGERLRAFGARQQGGKVGLAGAAYIPASVLDRVRAGLGGLTLESSPVLA